jgi:hypothetical protein
MSGISVSLRIWLPTKVTGVSQLNDKPIAARPTTRHGGTVTRGWTSIPLILLAEREELEPSSPAL